nr:HugZ family protein [Oryzicola mucosus]
MLSSWTRYRAVVEPKKDVIRETDAEAIRLGKTLMRTARFGALAAIEPGTGVPLASRVGVATDTDGTPLILISQLSAHTRAIDGNPACSLLLGEPGKGDPLAYPRITLFCRAMRLERSTPDYERAERRYLNRNPKAKLYVGLGDFSIHRLDVERASLNGGFGKAYLLDRSDLIHEGDHLVILAAGEQSALDHMNADHRDAIALYARHFSKASGDGWLLTGLDSDGMDLVNGDDVRRIFFERPAKEPADFHKLLVEMAKSSRAAVNAVS